MQAQAKAEIVATATGEGFAKEPEVDEAPRGLHKTIFRRQVNETSECDGGAVEGDTTEPEVAGETPVGENDMMFGYFFPTDVGKREE
ncbi:hypothetical protein EJB05_47554, partial [Eragrostis curvula]